MFTITHPKAGDIEFPDGTSDEDITKAMRQLDIETGIIKSKSEPKETTLFGALLPRYSERLSDSNRPLEKEVDKSQPEFIDTPGGKMFNSKKYETNPNYGKDVLATGLDIGTAPFRAVAAGVDALVHGKYGKDTGKIFKESLGDIKGKNIAGKVLRSPATPASLVVGGLTAGVGLPILGALGTNILTTSLGGAAATQLENINENKPVSLIEAAKDTGWGVMGGAAGLGVGQVLGGVAKGIANRFGNSGLIKKGAEKLIKIIKPTESQYASGFKKEKLIEHGIVGDPLESLQQAKDLITKSDEVIRDEISDIVKYNKGTEPTVNVIGVIDNIINDINPQTGKHVHLTPGFQNEQIKILNGIKNQIHQIDPSGNIKLSEMPSVKHVISEARGNFHIPPTNEQDLILGKTYSALDNEFYNTILNGRKNTSSQNAISMAEETLNQAKAIANKYKIHANSPQSMQTEKLVLDNNVKNTEKNLINIKEKAQSGINEATNLNTESKLKIQRPNEIMSDLIPIRNILEKKIAGGIIDSGKPSGIINTIKEYAPTVALDILGTKLGVPPLLTAAKMGRTDAINAVGKELSNIGGAKGISAFTAKQGENLRSIVREFKKSGKTDFDFQKIIDVIPESSPNKKYLDDIMDPLLKGKIEKNLSDKFEKQMLNDLDLNEYVDNINNSVPGFDKKGLSELYTRKKTDFTNNSINNIENIIKENIKDVSKVKDTVKKFTKKIINSTDGKTLGILGTISIPKSSK